MFKFFIKDSKYDYQAFKVEYDEEELKFRFDFKVFEVAGWDPVDNTPIDFEEYLSGVIKWDECSHIHIANKGYLHLCGKQFWDNHVKLMQTLFEFASKNIAKWDE